METPLDQLEKHQYNSTIFTNLALVSGIISTAIFGYFIILIPKTLKASEDIPQPSLLFIRGFQLSLLIGVIFSIIAIFKREPWSWKKWLSMILNLLMFILIGGSILFSYYIDSTK